MNCVSERVLPVLASRTKLQATKLLEHLKSKKDVTAGESSF